MQVKQNLKISNKTYLEVIFIFTVVRVFFHIFKETMATDMFVNKIEQPSPWFHICSENQLAVVFYRHL